jgi:hypothetical protein
LNTPSPTRTRPAAKETVKVVHLHGYGLRTVDASELNTLYDASNTYLVIAYSSTGIVEVRGKRTMPRKRTE